MGVVKLKSQLSLPDFCEAFDMKASTVKEFASRKENRLPAYKIGRKWWIDIEEFKKWRAQEHKRSYKYAW